MQALGASYLTILEYHDTGDSMKQMIIRNVPDDVHKDLRRMALEADISLNTLATHILTEAVEKAKKKAGKA